MFRRLSSISLLLASSLVVACGHQVTPEPVNALSDLSGDMQVKFQVAGPMDFQNVTYVIAMDLCGTGVPYPNAFTSGSYASYTFAFLVGGGLGTAEPLLFQYYLNPSSTGSLTKLQVPINPSITQFTFPYNGQNNEFEFTFPRSILNNPLQLALPCPNSTPVASTSPSATPTSTPTVSTGPTPTPNPSASATATPAASPTPSPSPTNADDSTGVSVPPYTFNWIFNMMTFSTGGNPVALDSLGLGGPQDVSFQGINVYTPTNGTYFQPRTPPYVIPSNQSAYISYAEVDTYP